MNFDRVIDRAWKTVCPLWFAGYCVLKGAENAKNIGLANSSVVLLKAGAMQVPFMLTIGIVAKKIFDSLGWEPSKARAFTIGMIACLSSATVTAIAATHFGWTGSFASGMMLSAINGQFALAAFGLAMSVQNTFYGTDNMPPQERLGF
ncbi:hypothetical protein PNK_0759 [Candidatus Protochlamydia naegleriophila]|uniref:Uncharacterized protein n=1 Tax=Candidatus Protochlamydia naegleriophila TaxID=389348 RepID=A0A0U5EQP3_9BACT|nr:hypothetical protein [Candidatus Protochlamydia naegleriophila]CUI16385.1 hypothetical protein PNK_0759 [Candidatus Protochlamydia naegleriophila]